MSGHLTRFREAFEAVPQRIAIVTSRADDGSVLVSAAHGVLPMTAAVDGGDQFLVVGLPRNEPAQPALPGDRAFAVHLLEPGAEGRWLAAVAADRAVDFDDALRLGVCGPPLIERASVAVECRPFRTVEAGDCDAVVGRVVAVHLAPPDEQR